VSELVIEPHDRGRRHLASRGGGPRLLAAIRGGAGHRRRQRPVGSNIFNILAVLGCRGSWPRRPPVSGALVTFDIPVMIAGGGRVPLPQSSRSGRDAPRLGGGSLPVLLRRLHLVPRPRGLRSTTAARLQRGDAGSSCLPAHRGAPGVCRGLAAWKRPASAPPSPVGRQRYRAARSDETTRSRLWR